MVPKDISSPFTPGVPVPVEFFIGRMSEVMALKQRVATAATDGRLQVVFLTGERGIGKSSLASFVRVVIAEREHRMIGVHTLLGGVQTLEETVRQIFDRLLNAGVDAPWFQKVKGLFGDRIRQVGLFGVTLEFAARDEDLTKLASGFAPALRRLLDQVRDERTGLFLVLDDINGLATSPQFANWLKSLVDEIATAQQPFPLCLVLVGLEERRQALIRSQPSLDRVFSLIEINPWTPEETREFYRKAFEGVHMSVDHKALEILVYYAGGLPVLAHEIGDAVFAMDEDGRVSEADALSGVLRAADIVGRKHLQPQVLEAIRSKHYRAILRKLTSGGSEVGFTFKRGDVLKHLTTAEEKVLDNFLRRMTDLGVIQRAAELGAGWYRFTNQLHRLYFMLEAAGPEPAR